MNALFFLLVLIITLSCHPNDPVDSALKPVMSLPAELKESSGMVSLGDGLYVGLNDSGNPAELFVYSLKEGANTRKVVVNNAENRDWEELDIDSQYIYIGNTGNNSGNRKDLSIYKVKLEDVKQMDTVTAVKISFYYPEQTTYKKGGKHNFDCEAMVASGDSLYLFTKNRGNHQTNLYRLPKQPGAYSAELIDEFDAGGLVTGAALETSGESKKLALIGYLEKDQGYHPFVIYFTGIQGNKFFQGKSNKTIFEGKMQTETVLFTPLGNLLITNEGEHGDKAMVYEFDPR